MPLLARDAVRKIVEDVTCAKCGAHKGQPCGNHECPQRAGADQSAPTHAAPATQTERARLTLVDTAVRATELRAEFVALGLPCTFEDWLCAKVAKLESDEARYDKLVVSAIGRIEDRAYSEGFSHGRMRERGEAP